MSQQEDITKYIQQSKNRYITNITSNRGSSLWTAPENKGMDCLPRVDLLQDFLLERGLSSEPSVGLGTISSAKDTFGSSKSSSNPGAKSSLEGDPEREDLWGGSELGLSWRILLIPVEVSSDSICNTKQGQVRAQQNQSSLVLTDEDESSDAGLYIHSMLYEMEHMHPTLLHNMYISAALQEKKSEIVEMVSIESGLFIRNTYKLF